MESHIANKYSHMVTAKEFGDMLESQYSKPSIASVYIEFKVMIDTNMPDGNHPAPAFVKLTASTLPVPEGVQVQNFKGDLGPFHPGQTLFLHKCCYPPHQYHSR